jgi:tRNA 2-thiouridine synthesizing protein A
MACAPEEVDMNADMKLDVSGTCCPVPIIQLAKTAQQMMSGQTLEVIGNDPLFQSSVHDFCLARGHALLSEATGVDRSVTMILRIGG